MTNLILASSSHARATMLRNAGVEIEIQPAEVDENTIKQDLLATGTPPDQIAAALGRAKALAVSNTLPDAFVIGADQVLVHDDNLFDKPRSLDEAKIHLKTLRGDTHRLVSAVSVAREGSEVWSVIRQADLTMREFTDVFLDSYLTNFGEKALTSVGAYHLEGLGAQLFSRVDGDYFTILGLPLLELLEFLRMRGLLTT